MFGGLVKLKVPALSNWFVSNRSQLADAENALKELPVSLPEVVLMDINLPGMNGVECVRHLKERLPKTQVVMLTVYENTNIIFSARSPRPL